MRAKSTVIQTRAAGEDHQVISLKKTQRPAAVNPALTAPSEKMQLANFRLKPSDTQPIPVTICRKMSLPATTLELTMRRRAPVLYSVARIIIWLYEWHISEMKFQRLLMADTNCSVIIVIWRSRMGSAKMIPFWVRAVNGKRYFF